MADTKNKKKIIHYTREQMKQLEDLDVINNFMTATVSDYKRGTLRSQDEKVADIYQAATGISPNRNFGCSVCSFRLYRDAGTLYYESKKFWEKYDKNKKDKKENKDGNK